MVQNACQIMPTSTPQDIHDLFNLLKNLLMTNTIIIVESGPSAARKLIFCIKSLKPTPMTHQSGALPKIIIV
jgi:hypothetical protein